MIYFQNNNSNILYAIIGRNLLHHKIWEYLAKFRSKLYKDKLRMN